MKMLTESKVPNVIEVPVNFDDTFADLVDGTYFIVSPINIYKLQKHPLLTTLIPCEGDQVALRKHIYGTNKSYDPKQAYMLTENNDFKIDAQDMALVMRFFREVYNKHKAESAVILLVNPATKNFKPLFVVNYDVSGGSVHYINPVETHTDERIKTLLKEEVVGTAHNRVLALYNQLFNEGYRIFGTIHSHCNFDAFHSGTDDADEIKQDGLHITVGNCNSGWSYAQRWGISGYFWPIKDIDVLLTKPIKEVEKLVDELEFDVEACLKHVFTTSDFSKTTNYGQFAMPHWKQDAFDGHDDDRYYSEKNHSGKQRYDPKTRSWKPQQEKLKYADMYDDIAKTVLGKAKKLKKSAGLDKQESETMQSVNMEELCHEYEDDIWTEEECVFVLDTDTNNTYIIRSDFYEANQESFENATNLRIINNSYDNPENLFDDAHKID